MTTNYEAVIFDNDGVLVEPTDTEVFVDAVVESFQAFGVDVERSLARRTVKNDTVPTEIAIEYDIDPEAFWHYRELTASLAQQRHVLNGGKPVYEDVAALDDLDMPFAVVSNNQQATIEFLLAHYDLPAFETAYGRQPTIAGAAKRKPEPDYIECALSDLGVENALYIGDSEKDLIAAQRAGIDSAFLRRDHVLDAEFSVAGTIEVSTLKEFVERLTTTTPERWPK